MLAQIVKVSSNLGSKLSSVATQAGTTFSRLKKSDIAEALIATWCVEFLRVRKIGGFNVVEIIVISVLMLGVKTIIMEASRRRYSGKGKSFVMSNRTTQMEPVVDGGLPNPTSGWRGRTHRFRQSLYRS